MSHAVFTSTPVSSFSSLSSRFFLSLAGLGYLTGPCFGGLNEGWESRPEIVAYYNQTAEYVGVGKTVTFKASGEQGELAPPWTWTHTWSTVWTSGRNPIH